MKILLDSVNTTGNFFYECGMTVYNTYDEIDSFVDTKLVEFIVKEMKTTENINDLESYYRIGEYEIYRFLFDGQEYCFHNPSKFLVKDGLLIVECNHIDGCLSNMFVAEKVSRIEHHHIASGIFEDAYNEHYEKLKAKESPKQKKPKMKVVNPDENAE